MRDTKYAISIKTYKVLYGTPCTYLENNEIRFICQYCFNVIKVYYFTYLICIWTRLWMLLTVLLILFLSFGQDILSFISTNYNFIILNKNNGFIDKLIALGHSLPWFSDIKTVASVNWISVAQHESFILTTCHKHERTCIYYIWINFIVLRINILFSLWKQILMFKQIGNVIDIFLWKCHKKSFKLISLICLSKFFYYIFSL